MNGQISVARNTRSRINKFPSPELQSLYDNDRYILIKKGCKNYYTNRVVTVS